MPNGIVPQEVLKTEQAPLATPVLEVPESSSVAADALALEQVQETEDAFLEHAPTQEQAAPPVSTNGQAAPTPTPAVVATVEKDAVFLDVEKILEEGLGAYFTQLPESAKERFQKKGEEVASHIAQMVRELRVKAKEVILLIRDWLLTIPGVNKFFLEQEAKIKTDRILQLEHDRHAALSAQP